MTFAVQGLSCGQSGQVATAKAYRRQVDLMKNKQRNLGALEKIQMPVAILTIIPRPWSEDSWLWVLSEVSFKIFCQTVLWSWNKMMWFSLIRFSYESLITEEKSWESFPQYSRDWKIGLYASAQSSHTGTLCNSRDAVISIRRRCTTVGLPWMKNQILNSMHLMV